MVSDLFRARDLVTAWLAAQTWSSPFPPSAVLLPTDRLEDVPESLRAYVIAGKLERTRLSRSTVGIVCEVLVFLHRRFDPAAPPDGLAEAALLEEIAAAADDLDLDGPAGELYRVLDATVTTTVDPDQFYKGILAGLVTLRIQRRN